MLSGQKGRLTYDMSKLARTDSRFELRLSVLEMQNWRRAAGSVSVAQWAREILNERAAVMIGERIALVAEKRLEFQAAKQGRRESMSEKRSFTPDWK